LDGIGFDSLPSTKETVPEITAVEPDVEEPLEPAPVVSSLHKLALVPASETPIDPVEELPLTEVTLEPVLAVAADTPEVEPVCEVPLKAPEVEPAQSPVLAYSPSHGIGFGSLGSKKETAPKVAYSHLHGIEFGSLGATKETVPGLTARESEADEPPELAPVAESETSIEELPPPVPEIETVKAPVVAAMEERATVGTSIEAAFEDAGRDGAAVTPPAADFLHLDVAPFGVAECYFMIAEDSFPACNGPAIPDVEVFCDAEFDPEERLASLLEPADLVAAGPVSSDTGRAAVTEPMAQAAARLARPSFRAWSAGTSTAPALEVAEIIEGPEIAASGHLSLQTARPAASQPMTLPQVPLELLAFHASAGDAAQPQVAEPIQLALLVQEIESAPLVFSDMALAPQIDTPAFQVSAVAMQLDEDLKRAIEPPRTEAVRMAEPEIARPAAMSAAPVSRAVSSTTFHPAATPASVRPEAHLNVPAMSSKTDLEPRLASEVVPDIAPGAAGEQPPAADTSQPVQPAIENSARIKNWRLKITFAKPA
jgi:hypothetical protein